MSELHARYRRAKERRTHACWIAFIAGTVGGALIGHDFGMALLAGLITSAIIGMGKSIEVYRLEKIIYPGGKR